MFKIIKLIFLLFFSHHLMSFEDPRKYPDIDSNIVDVKVYNPEQKVGYTVGDLIDRIVEISIRKPYQLIEESLPIEGYQKRYRGQLLGMDLKKISFIKKEDRDKTKYIINLQYQIFTNNVVAKPAFITADYYRIMDPAKPDDVFKVRIPELTVAISPIAIFGDIKVENDMSGYRGPILLDTEPYYIKLKQAIVLLIFFILVLTYIYSRYSWLPKQNRHFSHLYRKYKKTKFSKSNFEDFLKDLHGSFDKTLNQTLFLENTHLLYQQNSRFKYIKLEIEIFFKISRIVFFEQNKKIDNEAVYEWLKKFAFHCRMCERKLIIDSNDLINIKI